MHNFIPLSTLICADASWAAVLIHMSTAQSVCFVYVTWPCQSISRCRPSHRQLQDPDPEIQWPHPQTAASVSKNTKHASYSKDKFANTESMKYSGWTCRENSHVARVCVWQCVSEHSVLLMSARRRKEPRTTISVTQEHLCHHIPACIQSDCYLCTCVHVCIWAECAASL